MTHLKTEENGWVPALLSGVVDLKTLIEFGAAQPQLAAGTSHASFELITTVFPYNNVSCLILVADPAGGQQVDERVRDIERRKKRMYLLGFLLVCS